MTSLTILRNYALKSPTELPNSILFSHSDKTLTIYDAYPKSIFHFLILPRILVNTSSSKDDANAPSTPKWPSIGNLSNLRILLNSSRVSKDEAKHVILALRDEANKLKVEIEQEMEKRYGFVWGVWTGFHGTPSMEHLHLHVLSADLCSEKMKHKKHYNSFQPKLGFFIHMDEVLSWFDAEPSYYRTVVKLLTSKYEPLLKEPLLCFHCNMEMRNMPLLKKHLQEEWEKLQKRAESSRKRRLQLEAKLQKRSASPSVSGSQGKSTDDDVVEVDVDGEHESKRLKPDNS